MEKLVCIIAGPGHNGTTYLKNLLDSHPYIFSGFETGLSLDNDFEKCHPFKNMIFKDGFMWGMPKHINLFDKSLTINDKYKLLMDNKGSYEGPIQKLIKNSTFLVDKTPHYFIELPKVCKLLNNNEIPILLTIKYFKESYVSYVIKRKVDIDFFIKQIHIWMNSLIWIKKNKNILTHIYLFRYEDVLKPVFIDKLKQIISKRIDINHEMSFDKYLEKLPDKEKLKRPYGDWIPEDNTDINFPLEFKDLEHKFNTLINEIKESI